jgi:two-component system, chemotaxis family, CheB/CheR fusion protein
MNRETFECERELGKSAEEAEGMVRLHEFSTRLVATTELPLLLEEVLNATIALQCADFGNVQLYNPRTQGLEIVAQRGLGQDFLDHFGSAKESGAACFRALKRAERVIIEDVLTDPDFAPHCAIGADVLQLCSRAEGRGR